MHKLLFYFLFALFYCSIGFFIFIPIYLSDSIIITFSVRPFDICTSYPIFWFYFKLIFIILYVFSSIIYSNIFYKFISKYFIKPKNNLNIKLNNKEINLLVGQDTNSNKVYLSEKSLYQNILITGTIGSGKTSSAIYPFSEQLIKYCCNDDKNKIGILFLDVKGNFVNQIYNYAKKYNRLSDLIIIGLNSNNTYNPLDKPNLKPSVLANRLKIILSLFSPNNSESYWLDKAEQILTEAIKLCRLYNNGYVNFKEIHNLINNKDYFNKQISFLRLEFQKNKFSSSSIYDLYSSISFFENEFFSLDDRTSSILKSEISRITNIFISDYDILRIFSPNKSEITFNGFESLIQDGKLVVLSMNIAEYRNLSKIIATYLKLDFQSEVLQRVKNNSILNSRTVAFVCDEFHEYVTSTDSDFFAQSRESKCINIVATQSYSSLLNTLHNESVLKVIIQNLTNKLWFRSDDLFTIENAQKQIGKEEKEKISTTISENSKETFYNYFLNNFNSINSNISESYNKYLQTDFIYDINFFSRELETFSCISFLSDGNKILNPCKLNMFPYFK